MVGGGGLEADTAGSKSGEVRLADFHRNEGFNDTGDASGGLRLSKLGTFGNDLETEG